MKHCYGVKVSRDEAPEIMRQIEERSNAKWANGELPAEYDPGALAGQCATKGKWYLFLLRSGITYCDCDKVPDLLNPKILFPSEFIEQCALQYPKLMEFKVGDRVQIVRRIEFRGIWVDTMDATLGCFGTVEGLPAPGYVTVRPDDSRLSWNYPPEALARQVDALPGIMDAVVKRTAMAVSCPPEMMKAKWTPEAGASVSTEPIKCPDCNGTGRGSISPVKQFAPTTTKCPNPGWLGTWIDVDRLIIDVEWSGDKPYGPWEAHRYQEDGCCPVWRPYSDTWRGPRSEGWVRPEKLKSPLLGRPKARTRVCVPWDPEDMG